METTISFDWGDQPVLTIDRARGDLSLIPGRRKWRIGLRGFHRDITVCGGTVTRDIASNTTWVCVEADVTQSVTIRISSEKLIHDNCDVTERIEHIIASINGPLFDKSRLMRMLDPTQYKSQLSQICDLRGSGIASGKPIAELMTLTEDPYLGSQL